MLIAGNPRIMGRLTVSPAMLISGWAATLVMLIASVAFFLV